MELGPARIEVWWCESRSGGEGEAAVGGKGTPAAGGEGTPAAGAKADPAGGAARARRQAREDGGCSTGGCNGAERRREPGKRVFSAP